MNTRRLFLIAQLALSLSCVDGGLDPGSGSGGISGGTSQGGTPPVAPPEPPQPESPRFRKEWTVSPAGSDGANGTAQAPFKTISRAVLAAEPGDRILVLSGTYRENVTIGPAARAGRADAPIVLQGQGKPRIIPATNAWMLVSIERPHWNTPGCRRGRACAGHTR